MKSRLHRAPRPRRVAAILLAACNAAVLAAFAPAAAAADMNAVNNAAKIASNVGAGTAVPSVGVGAVLQTLVGLAVVVALVFACAWLARRLGLQPSGRGQLVRTVGGVSLGGKERVTVVEIGDTWLVLGAAPGSVRLLHTMPAAARGVPGGEADSPDGALPGTFGARFRSALGNEAKKRFSRPSGGGQ
ncbi:flagellar biosynthetic protein FliO [Trinickia dabaoshanensis]|uniref:Flagellar protein n=1 Tax=Trinickia dabaoshanensis TaxID=564714 RepID=A0A2N7VZ90_9BURK|nr:flagellar biosynthetic protein FliO [Trinickia dabaoshanensis]PMS22479.1 flagellar biosynthetic protein FliO [Trinickia dabaoshanensis]